MLISPPFLVGTDEASILQAGLKNVPARESTTQAPEGNFPVSQNLMWHTGVHLEAPTKAEGGYVPVRAIADGKVIFVNPPRAKVTDAKDPQAYNPFGNDASWTDNGMIVLEHETEIGADGDTPTKIKFYSSYLHLSKINDGVAKDAQIYRKDTLGETGEIFGHAGEIEMAIACNTEELKKLIGREPEWQDPKQVPTKDGREDSIFGSLYIYLPASTPTSATAPTSHLRSANTASLGTAQWVEINYAKGQGELTSYALDGSKGNTTNEANSEYNLYTEANTRHDSVIAAGATVSSPSGWYELLRFGRNLGRSATDRDPLPPNAAHWRKIKTIDGQDIWADLNAPGSFKFSEADFLPVMGWNCYGDDSKPDDQRCDSTKLKDLIADPNDPFTKGDKILAMRIGLPDVLPKLARTICKFPNEWDKDTIVVRYQYMKDEAEAAAAGALEGWSAFEDHLKIMAFDTLPASFKAADWHFHPAEFIRTLRRCGWLSLNELGPVLPRYSYYAATGNPRLFSSQHEISLATSKSRFAVHQLGLNIAMRKYLIDTGNRRAHFLAQTIIETDRWKVTSEYGSGAPNAGIPMAQYYAAFYGRGIMQLTWAGNYEKYDDFRKFPNNPTGQYVDNRITSTSLHYFGDPTTRDSHGNITGLDPHKPPKRWAPRFDPVVLKTDTKIATDSGGFYWAWQKINRKCDNGIEPSDVHGVNIAVNGGGFGYYERQAYTKYLTRYFLDDVSTTTSEDFVTPRNHISVRVNYEKPQ